MESKRIFLKNLSILKYMSRDVICFCTQIHSCKSCIHLSEDASAVVWYYKGPFYEGEFLNQEQLY